MRCPYCSTDLSRSPRAERRCSVCGHSFAFDPRLDKLAFTDQRFLYVTNRLSAKGTLFYTPYQLLHQLYRRRLPPTQRRTTSLTLTPSSSPRWLRNSLDYLAHQLQVNKIGDLLFAVLFVIVAAYFSPPIGFLLFLAMIAFSSWWSNKFKHHPPNIPLPFDRRLADQTVSRWKSVYGAYPPGLIVSDTRDTQRQPRVEPPAMQAVIVCPERDIYDCLLANHVIEPLGLSFLSTTAALSREDEAVLAHVRANPHLPLLLLHDASVRGCLLRHEIRTMFRLSEQQRVIDLGLRPRQVVRYGLMTMEGGEFAWKRFEALRAAESSAPHPALALTDEDMAWLSRGAYSPLLAVTPARLIRMVTQAVERYGLDPTRRRSDEQLPALQAAREADAVGFMTWPT